jgi:N-acetyl-gamma-glutamyl-phosphate reductase
MKPTVFIDGAVGTTGLEIAARLASRDDLALLTLDDTQRKDLGARRDALNAADLVILCLPDDAAREAVALIDNAHTRVIDASTAHRTAPHWCYGFPEWVGRDAVHNARFVANPGCYATGFIALVAPLVRAGLIAPAAPMTCNAVSGYSGGGKAMIAAFENDAAPTAWQGYALGLSHKHVPEMQHHTGLSTPPLFAPSVANTYRGMIVDVPIQIGSLMSKPSAATLRDCLAAHYAGSPLVRVITDYEAANLPIEYAADSDRLDLFVFGNPTDTQVRLVAALDNLGKGAAGAAVQNLNIMLGVDETMGLKL